MASEKVVSLSKEVKSKKINFRLWAKFLAYYRYYIDAFAIDILGLRLYPFQRFTLRAAARYKEGILIGQEVCLNHLLLVYLLFVMRYYTQGLR